MQGQRKNSIVVFTTAEVTAGFPMRLAAILVMGLSLAINCAEAQQSAPVVWINLDQAIGLALQHNHALQAARTTIQQSEAQEVTANLRPNPVLSGDYLFVPVFSPSFFGVPASQLPLPQEGDANLAYTIELWHKRQARLTAARDQSSVTRSLVADNERSLTFDVASQFINVLLAESTFDFAQQDLKSFRDTVDIGAARYKAGDISEGDYLKIKLQLLQFQTDVSTAQLAKIQALAALRQLVGFESVSDQFDVEGQLEYLPVRTGLDDLKALALRSRPDLRAAQQSVVGTQSQYRLAKANGKPDVTPQLGWSHAAGEHTLNFGLSIELPIFNRNQGEVARTRYTITQSQELASEAGQQVLTDVVNAYAAMHTSDQIVQFYRGGYADEAKKSLDISEYAYRRGATSLLDFLDAERTYRANQLAYRQALATYMTALEQTRQAVGTRRLP
jgi:cobalt-zinc-cadmium efflux system outer membrane protein